MSDFTFVLQLIVLLAITIALPAALARWRAGAGWIQIGCAFATWGTILLSVFVAFAGLDSPGEAIIGIAVFAMFFGWMAVPLMALTYQATNTPGWMIAQWQQRSRP